MFIMFIFSKKELGFPTFNIQNNLMSSLGPHARVMCLMQYQRNPERKVGIPYEDCQSCITEFHQCSQFYKNKAFQ